MRPKITIVGAGDECEACVERLGRDDYADIVRDIDEISGSAVAVLFEGGDEIYVRVRERAPNAVVVVAGGSPDAACQATLFPRSRIIGVDAAANTIVDVVEAIVLDRRHTVTCVVRCEGERGIDGEFAAVPVRLGAGGVREILEDARA